MKVLLQRVTEASVTIASQRVAQIGPGLLVFLGVEPKDGSEQIRWMVDKVLGLRIFPDDIKPMNRSVVDVAGEVLVVSQFTLAADVGKGRRPGFSTAAEPGLAEQCYRQFVARMRDVYPRLATGEFGADMRVALVNDGPVTFLIER